MKSVSTSDAIFNMIASNSDSLHSLSDGRSPSTTTNDSNSKLSDSLEVSAPHYGETSVDRQNLLLTEVIKQLCQVSQRADDIFSRLKRDLGDIQSRSSRLHDRITVLSSKTEEIASTPVPLVASRFPKSPPKCFQLTYTSDCRNLFLPSSRPATLEKMYQQCGKVTIPDDDDFESNPVDRSTPLHRSLTDDQNSSQTDGKRNSYMAASWFEAESRKLPTPQELVQSKSQQFAATVIPVDTSGSTIKRLSDTRKNELYAEICKPKLRSSTSPLLNQTVPITTTTIKSISAEDRLAQSKWKRKSYAGYARPRLPPTPESSDSWLQALPKSTKEKRKSLEITTTTTTVGNETEYEWSDDPLPHSNTFSNRRKTFNHSITQFLSLRRPKKEKNSMVPPSIPPKKQQNCQPDLNHQSHSSLETDSSASQPEAKNIGSSFKRFLFRSVSLRQPRKTPMKKRLSPDFSEELLYENYTPHCHNRNLQSCGSSSIPEYANFEVSSHFQLAPPTTQVLQVTNRLRNRLDSATTITSPGSSLVDETNWQQAKMTGGNGEGSKKYRVLAVAPRISDKVKLNSLQKSKRHLTSVSSYGSNTSLDWNRNNKGGYQRGYQMDYPDECVLTNNRKNFFNENCKMDFPSENEFSSRLFYSDHRKLEENDDFSLGNSSAFSCDQDGYYTSMHMDSGINLRHTTSVSRLKPGSFAHPFGALNSSDDNDTSHSGSLTSSVNPSPATVMPVLEEDNTSQDDEANLPLCNLPPPNPDVFNLLVGGIDDSPPVSENHLASVDVHHQEDKLSRKTLKIGPAEIADDLLDDWLLQKFKLESSQCGSTTKSPVIISISPNETLPLSKAVHNCSIQAEKQFLTFPRKTVRFCD